MYPKKKSEYARILSVSDAVHSVRSLWSNMPKGRDEVCGTTAL